MKTAAFNGGAASSLRRGTICSRGAIFADSVFQSAFRMGCFVAIEIDAIAAKESTTESFHNPTPCWTRQLKARLPILGTVLSVYTAPNQPRGVIRMCFNKASGSEDFLANQSVERIRHSCQAFCLMDFQMKEGLCMTGIQPQQCHTSPAGYFFVAELQKSVGS